MDSPIYEGNTDNFHAISSQAEDALVGFSDDEWNDLLVGVAIFEGSRASGRSPGAVTSPIEESPSGLFVLDLTVFGGPAKLVCARRGREVLIARVVARGRRVGQKEIGHAESAVKEWRREHGPRRADARAEGR
jgi:hypothetical protein